MKTMKTPKAGAVKGKLKYCGQCKTWKEISVFYNAPKGYRVRACFVCVKENMRRWAGDIRKYGAKNPHDILNDIIEI